jgi:ABC-type dipeptide/oligopeptide/nickel transport system ATPase subunit
MQLNFSLPANLSERLIAFWQKVRLERVIVLLSVVVAFIATALSYKHGYIVAYGDAESHLNIAKRVLDSLTPGFAQLGGIWLPLPHLLMIPFVSVDHLWRSGLTNEQLKEIIEHAGLQKLLARFDQGLDTPVASSGDSISLGQRQLVAFMRAVLREPELLILDEATANIDTVTEQLLEEILQKLPTSTTKVIIAHRLNTIENADEIFFVNSGEVVRAGSLNHAVEMLMHGKRES